MLDLVLFIRSIIIKSIRCYLRVCGHVSKMSAHFLLGFRSKIPYLKYVRRFKIRVSGSFVEILRNNATFPDQPS